MPHHHPLNLENNNTVELVDAATAHHQTTHHIEEDSKDPLVCHPQEIPATAAPTSVPVPQETSSAETTSETSQFYP